MESNTQDRSLLKSIRRYFFDFLMMFLAVAAGFFSENLRQENADKRKQVHFLQNVNTYYIDIASTLLKSAKQTLALIEKEYATSDLVQSKIK